MKYIQWIKFYAWNILLALDQLCNAILAGDPAETISRRAGQAAFEGKPWACYLCRLLDAIDARHCMSAQERMDTGNGEYSVAALMEAWENGTNKEITG